MAAPRRTQQQQQQPPTAVPTTRNITKPTATGGVVGNIRRQPLVPTQYTRRCLLQAKQRMPPPPAVVVFEDPDDEFQQPPASNYYYRHNEKPLLSPRNKQQPQQQLLGATVDDDATLKNNSNLSVTSTWPLGGGGGGGYEHHELPEISINNIPLAHTRIIGRGGCSFIMAGTLISNSVRQQQFAIKVFHSPRQTQREFDSILRSELVALRLPPDERVIRTLFVSAFCRVNDDVGGQKADNNYCETKHTYGIVVMQRVCMGNLQQLLAGELKISPKQHVVELESTTALSSLGATLDICMQLASAAGFLHAHSIAHLDIKPANILIDAASSASASIDKVNEQKRRPQRTFLCSLGDFGSAIDLKDPPTTPTATHKIALRCTIPYEAPELYVGRMPTTKCDIFSLAFVYWQLLTQNVFVHALDDCGTPLASHQFIYKIVKYKWRPSLQALPAPHNNSSYCGGWLHELLTNMWHEDPQQRYDTSQVLHVIGNNNSNMA